MKTNIQNFKHVLVAALVLLMNVSCEKSEPSIDADAFLNMEEVSQNAIIDVISDEVDNIAENVYYVDEQQLLAGKSGVMLKDTEEMSYLSDCVVVSSLTTETHTEKNLDFVEGCITANGNVLRGMIHLSYEKDMEADVNTIQLSFEDFYFNDAGISGERVVVRERMNADGNPQATITHTINVTWSDGKTARREGVKVREWIEGVANGIWEDNVYIVSGNWTTTFSSGNIHQGAVIVPLRRELSCRFLVSGMLQLQRNDRTGTLDFGNGACDSEAIFTSADGNSNVVSLH